MEISTKNRSFGFLNATQFFDELNENLFKYIVVYFLIFYQGEKNTSLIMSITGAIFLLPFILFSSLGGIFADRWSKTIVIRTTRFFHLGIMILALISMWFEAIVLTYVILFVMASVSAIFGSSKYGIIPEVVPQDKILRANGFIAAFTFFGRILGTSFASLLDTLIQQVFYLMMIACLCVSLTGMILSFFIAYIPPAHGDKKWPFFLYREIYDSLKEMRHTPYLLTATFAYSYFLFIGAFVQMNIIPYSVATLHMKPIVGGYLFIFSSIGIGIGALMAAKMSGNLTILPKAGLGMTVGCFLFTLFPHPFWLNIVWLIALGIFGGLFLVPSQAFILSKSELQNRGRNFGTANFLSFVFALLAAGYLYLINTLFKFTPAESFAIMGFVNFAVIILIYFLTRKSVSS